MKRLRIILPAVGLVLLTALFFLLPVVWRQRTARTAAKAQVRSVALTEPAALTPEEIADLISVASDIDGKVQVTTLDAPVRDFVRMREETIEFEQKWHDLLDVVMPGYVAEGKQQLAIGVGCTGGQHRSVAMSEELARRLRAHGLNVTVSAREQHKRHSS